ncbi:MAG: hypothetical protein Q4B04_04580 [bacterium]|nr:hypothetical protein [bacterium]
MLKGVNKRIIEVCETGNEYFEKVLLFVSPEHSNISESKLVKQAQRYVELIKKSDSLSGLYNQTRKPIPRRQLLIGVVVCAIVLIAGMVLYNLR